MVFQRNGVRIGGLEAAGNRCHARDERLGLRIRRNQFHGGKHFFRLRIFPFVKENALLAVVGFPYAVPHDLLSVFLQHPVAGFTSETDGNFNVFAVFVMETQFHHCFPRDAVSCGLKECDRTELSVERKQNFFRKLRMLFRAQTDGGTVFIVIETDDIELQVSEHIFMVEERAELLDAAFLPDGINGVVLVVVESSVGDGGDVHRNGFAAFAFVFGERFGTLAEFRSAHGVAFRRELAEPRFQRFRRTRNQNEAFAFRRKTQKKFSVLRNIGLFFERVDDDGSLRSGQNGGDQFRRGVHIAEVPAGEVSIAEAADFNSRNGISGFRIGDFRSRLNSAFLKNRTDERDVAEIRQSSRDDM